LPLLFSCTPSKSKLDAAYILSTFSGTSETDPTLPGTTSPAEHILDTYDFLMSQR